MKKIFLYILSSLSAAIIPAMITASVLMMLFLTPGFYVSIIKNLDLVKTFIEAKNLESEKEITREIEKKTGINSFKPEYEGIKKQYDEKLLAYNTLNKTDEYEKIKKQMDELDDLEWEKSPDSFKKEEDFDSFKKLKMKEFKTALKGIEKYRDSNEDAIDKSEDEMKKAKDLFEDADDRLTDKKNEARKIIEEREGDFMNEMYHDIAKIEPALTGMLNRLFIDREIRGIITEYLDFFTSYPAQKKAGNVYGTRLNVETGMIESSSNVNIPPLRLSFIVKTNENGIEKDKNLFSELFVETIRDTPGLKSPWIMTKIFSLSDSWLVEKIGNTLLKDTPLSYRNGVITSGPLLLSGEKGKIAERIMMFMTGAKYLPYITAVISLILLLTVFILSADRRSGLRNTGYILKYPAMIISIAGIALILLTLVPGILLPEAISDPVKYAFIDRAAMVSAIHVFAPIAILFFVISIIGSLMVRLGKR